MGSSITIPKECTDRVITYCWNNQECVGIPKSSNLLLWSSRIDRYERLQNYIPNQWSTQIQKATQISNLNWVAAGHPINLAAYHPVRYIDDDPSLILYALQSIKPFYQRLQSEYPSLLFSSPIVYPTYDLQTKVGSWSKLMMTFSHSITISMRWDESQINGLLDPDTQSPGSPWWWVPLSRIYPVKLVHVGRAFHTQSYDEYKYKQELHFVLGVLRELKIDSASIFGWNLEQHPNYDIRNTSIDSKYFR